MKTVINQSEYDYKYPIIIKDHITEKGQIKYMYLENVKVFKNICDDIWHISAFNKNGAFRVFDNFRRFIRQFALLPCIFGACYSRF